MIDVQPDPTDTGTIRPKQKPLQKKGTQLKSEPPRLLLPGDPNDALSILSLFFSDLMLDIIVENTNKHVKREPRPKQPNARDSARA
jgi:hypothetical protein